MTVQTIDNRDKLNQESSEQFRGKWSVIREKKGKISSSRILLLLWGIGLFVVWSFVSLVNRNIAEIPESVVTVLGILSGSKVVQRFGENIDKD
jgi:hypothetical protein